MEIVDDLVEMGVKAVTCSGGGEPLIYPHIAEPHIAGTVERLERPPREGRRRLTPGSPAVQR